MNPSTKTYRLNKVPEVTLSFWVIKIMSTTVGETMAELLARMRAVMRRKGGTAASLLGNGVVSLDPVSKQASSDEASTVAAT